MCARFYKSVIFFLLLFSLSTLPSCMSLTHIVGEGGRKGIETKKTEWYILFGFVPVSATDSKEMAEGAKDYTIKTEVTFIDILTNIILFPLTLTTQTVTVVR